MAVALRREPWIGIERYGSVKLFKLGVVGSSPTCHPHTTLNLCSWIFNVQMIYDGGVAQLGERLDSLQKVGGSSPLFPTIYHFESFVLLIRP